MRNVHKKRARDKQNYLRNKESKRQASRNKYWKNPEKQRASSRAYSLTSYWKNPEKKRASSHTRYWEDPETKRASSHTRYWEDPETKRASSHTRYWEDPETKRASSHTRYWEDPETKRASSHTRYWEDPETKRASSHTRYWEDPETKRASSHTRYWEDPETKRASSHTRYWEDPETKRASSHTRYWEDPDKGRAASRVSSRTSYWRDPDKKRAAVRMTNLKAARAKLKWYRRYYAKHAKGICASRRNRYALAEPKGSVVEVHVKRIQYQLLANAGTKLELVEAFKKQSKTAAKQLHKSMVKTVCLIAAKRLCNKALQLRKEHVGTLLKTTRAVQNLKIKGRDDFVEGCHTIASEPYYYDSAYHPVKRPCAIPIKENGMCIVANEISNSENDSTKTKEDQPYKQWNCHSECKVVTDTEVAAIVHLRQAFDKPMHELRNALDTCDNGCPNQHHTRVVGRGDLGLGVIELQGHPLVCSNDGGCHSQLRILRAASTHYGVLRILLNHVYTARRSHLSVVSIDKALIAGDFHSLMKITKVHDLADLLTADLDSSYQQSADDDVGTVSVPQSLETQLLITHAQTISDLEKEIDDDPMHPCCSCERLQQRKCVTRVSLSDNLGSKVWPALKAFMLEQNPDVNKQVLYMCNYCKPLIKQDTLPARCVLNGLQTVPMPPELAKLDCLSKQLIQRAKCYQTVVRLGTYTAKVPVYNSLKACKGTMFFLPLPFNKTLETLGEVKHLSSALPEPELYIILNGKPTKQQVV